MESDSKLMQQLQQRGVDGGKMMKEHYTDMEQKLVDRESELVNLRQELVDRSASVQKALDGVAVFERDLEEARQTMDQEEESTEAVLKAKVEQVNCLLKLVQKKTIELDKGREDITRLKETLDDKRNVARDQEQTLRQQETQLREMMELITHQQTTLASFAEHEHLNDRKEAEAVLQQQEKQPLREQSQSPLPEQQQEKQQYQQQQQQEKQQYQQSPEPKEIPQSTNVKEKPLHSDTESETSSEIEIHHEIQPEGTPQQPTARSRSGGSEVTYKISNNLLCNIT